MPEMALTVVEDFPTKDIALLRKERNLLASKRISNPVAVTLVYPVIERYFIVWPNWRVSLFSSVFCVQVPLRVLPKMVHENDMPSLKTNVTAPSLMPTYSNALLILVSTPEVTAVPARLERVLSLWRSTAAPL